MGLIDVTIKAGEAASESSSWYDGPFFVAISSSIIAAIVSIVAIQYDHFKQRSAREAEDKEKELIDKTAKEKRLRDLENYFFEMCDVLSSAIEDQIISYKSILTQVQENRYMPIVRKTVPSLNLNKIYYLSPGQMFEIFVTEKAGDSRENAKSLIEIFKAFDGIQGVKDLDATSQALTNRKVETAVEEFFTAVQKIDTYKREIMYIISSKNGDFIQQFAQGIIQIFEELRKNSRLEATQDELIAEPINKIIITNRFLDNLHSYLQKEIYLSVPYRVKFIDLINDAKIALREYDTILDYLKEVTDNYIESLARHKQAILKETSFLRRGN